MKSTVFIESIVRMVDPCMMVFREEKSLLEFIEAMRMSNYHRFVQFNLFSSGLFSGFHAQDEY